MQNEAADLLPYHGLCLEDAVRYHQGCDLRQRNVTPGLAGRAVTAASHPLFSQGKKRVAWVVRAGRRETRCV